MELNLAQIHEAIAQVIPERDCIVHAGRHLSWAEVTSRTRRFANALNQAGLGRRQGSLASLEGWESPHDHVALYLHNGVEYLEAMLGTMKAGAAAINVNYKYVAEELKYLLNDAQARAIVYHEAFTPTLAEVLPELEGVSLLVRVADGTGHAPLPGSIDYEAFLAAVSDELSPQLVESWSGDDLYLLYTGGTTGMPKGVCWRQADFLVAALGIRHKNGTEYESLEPIVERARRQGLRTLPSAPFMHGAAHWNAISAWVAGGTVVIQSETTRLDAIDIWQTIENENVSSLLIVGDAFARPLVDELDRNSYNLGSLRFILTGGAALGPDLAQRFVDHVPNVTIVDVLGSSESGRMGTRSSKAGDAIATGKFVPSETSVVLSDDLTRVLEAGGDEIGWLAQSGRIPRGYLGDPDKTAATFPVIEGVRYSVPGDRARHLADGSIELHGRDSATINSGGEKIFAEEVEDALKRHPQVTDAIVVGRSSPRWGQEVVAIVSLRPEASVSDDDLRDTAARYIARYKLPKAIIRHSEIPRSPAGKADYRWAKETALGS